MILEVMKESEKEPWGPPGPPLVDLHIHVGGAVAPHILFAIAHQQGFKLPVKGYWEFVDLVTADPKKVKNLDDYLKILHEYTEKIQSSPAAVERSVYEIIGKEYRGSHVKHIELRFNPMKRNLGGERDLDHIIHAAIRGMDRATLEYGVTAGLIFCLAREFSVEMNEVIIDKAIKYRARGVVGVDIAGPERLALELRDGEVAQYGRLFGKARDAGLGVTIHTGETKDTGAQGIINVLKHWRPHRIGHGIWATKNPEALQLLKEQKVVLELCPTSNVNTHAVADWGEFREITRTFVKEGVPITINTDGPYALKTNMRTEVELCLEHNVLSQDEIVRALEVARAATFVRNL
jgi:adenosine deaminase